MASIERRQLGGRSAPVRWQVRWRDEAGRSRSKTFDREDEARCFRVRLDGDLAAGTWVDPALSKVTLGEWVRQWRDTVVDLRPTSLARIDATVSTHVLPEWGGVPLSGVTNADVRAWAARLHGSGLSASTVRKAVFALRRILAAAVADRRLAHNPADNVPLPAEEPGEQRYLTIAEVEALASVIEPRFRAMVLVAAYGGLRFGELTALRRQRVDVLRGRVVVAETLVQVGAELSFGPAKTRRGRRTVPLPRRISHELADHLERYVPRQADALVFTGLHGQPLRREWFRRTWWLSAVRTAALDGLRFHDMRHLRLAADQRRRERQGGIHLGRPFLGRVHPRPLWPPLRRRRRLHARPPRRPARPRPPRNDSASPAVPQPLRGRPMSPRLDVRDPDTDLHQRLHRQRPSRMLTAQRCPHPADPAARWCAGRRTVASHERTSAEDGPQQRHRRRLDRAAHPGPPRAHHHGRPHRGADRTRRRRGRDRPARPGTGAGPPNQARRAPLLKPLPERDSSAGTPAPEAQWVPPWEE